MSLKPANTPSTRANKKNNQILPYLYVHILQNYTGLGEYDKGEELSWDGKFNGNYCAPGIYVYYLKGEGFEERQAAYENENTNNLNKTMLESFVAQVD